jgi:hypothetical protein
MGFVCIFLKNTTVEFFVCERENYWIAQASQYLNKIFKGALTE